MFQSREAVLSGLARVGAHLCVYSGGEPDDWHLSHCDCKYLQGRPLDVNTGEKTGCCEVRDAHAVLSAMTDEEWATRCSALILPQR